MRATKTQWVYERIRSRIEHAELRAGDRLPSVRRCAEELGLSRGTIEIAYAQLELEGYVSSVPRSGVYVQNIEFIPLRDRQLRDQALCDQELSRSGRHALTDRDRTIVLSSFASAAETVSGSDGMLPEDFDYMRWKKAMARILEDRRERLGMVLDPAGEPELRHEIARFISHYRDVRCHPHQIVVAAGTQILLSAIAAAARRRGFSCIAFEHPGFGKGAQVFADTGFTLHRIPVLSDGIRVDVLRESGCPLVYVSPAHQYPSGAVMSISNRYRLLNWAEERGGIILEDDYDGMLRYAGSPIPSLQGLTTKDNVIYLGSFSKLLPPSMRISYMVLPESFDRSQLTLYNQSAGKLDQLVLATWLADGSMERHLRRLRKSYGQKAMQLVRRFEMDGRGQIAVEGWESGSTVVLRLRRAIPAGEARETGADEAAAYNERFEAACRRLGLTVQALDEDRYILAYSGLAEGAIADTVRALCDIMGRTQNESMEVEP